MWYATEFNGQALPRGNFSLVLPRTFAANRLRPTGALLGDYDLDGVANRLVQQQYQAEFTVAACDVNAAIDAILGATRRSGLLKITDNATTRRATAKVETINDVTTIDDWVSKRTRLAVQFSVEPYWYSESLTTLTFTSSTYVSLRTSYNSGNARAIKYVVLTITSAVAAPLTINVIPTGPYYYGEFLYGVRAYGASTPSNQTVEGAQLVYGASTTGTLVINAGASTVQEDGVDVYANVTRPGTQMALLWLDPGPQVMRFSQAVTGTLQFRSCWV